MRQASRVSASRGSIGIHQVSIRYPSRIHPVPVSIGYPLDIHPGYPLDIHPVSTRYPSGIHPVSIRYLLSIHPTYPLGIHPVSIRYPSGIHQVSIRYPSRVHKVSTRCPPGAGIHHMSVRYRYPSSVSIKCIHAVAIGYEVYPSDFQ